MKFTRPTRVGGWQASAQLTSEEKLLLTRIDGSLSSDELAILTGIARPRVDAILEKLVSEGAARLEVVDGESARVAYPSSPDVIPSQGSLATMMMNESADDYAVPVERPSRRPVLESNAPEPPAEVALEPSALPAAISEPPAEPAEEEASAADRVRILHARYAAKFQGLLVDVRAGQARTVQGEDLAALCFDAEPRVIGAVLENPTAGLEHARLIAAHHHTSTGLEMVSRRAEFLRDGLVERRLLRNGQAGDVVLGRLLNPKRLVPIYQLSIDREVPELTRQKARGFLHKKWASAPPEERADLVQRTDGRCLAVMTGCTFDARTTQILCGRTQPSMLFIQNVAKFGASPPALLSYLVKQPFVRKNPGMRRMLLQHPNMPGEVKRNL